MLGAVPWAILKVPVPAIFELVHPRLPAMPTTPALLLPPQKSSLSCTFVRSAALNGTPPPPRTICASAGATNCHHGVTYESTLGTEVTAKAPSRIATAPMRKSDVRCHSGAGAVRTPAASRGRSSVIASLDSENHVRLLSV